MDLKHGKYLGVDYGDVRTGLAVSDALGFLASGIGTIRPGGMRNTAEAVAREAVSQGVRAAELQGMTHSSCHQRVFFSNT